MKVCVKCGALIVGRRPESKYCSEKCKKLFLKSGWRKRNAEKQRLYQREYRRAKNGGNKPLGNPAMRRDKECLKCGSAQDLQACHVKPLWAGGTHRYIITLCRTHHHIFDDLLREFWK